jgi:hypothetical protein
MATLTPAARRALKYIVARHAHVTSERIRWFAVEMVGLRCSRETLGELEIAGMVRVGVSSKYASLCHVAPTDKGRAALGVAS